MNILLTCQEVAEILANQDGGSLALALRWRIRLHLSVCHGCQVLQATLGVTPRVCREVLAETVPETPEAARTALRGAMALLRDGWRPRSQKVDPVPEELARIPAPTADQPLCLLLETREALAHGNPRHASYLPASVMEQLPPPELWAWRDHAHAKSVVLFEAEDRPLRLILLHALPGYQQPTHTHQGSESILVLEGHLEDGDQVYSAGRWIHHGDATSHAPAALGQGCWCLIREEGFARSRGFLGRGRNPLAA